jgi:hypothetical protein
MDTLSGIIGRLSINLHLFNKKIGFVAVQPKSFAFEVVR